MDEFTDETYSNDEGYEIINGKDEILDYMNSKNINEIKAHEYTLSDKKFYCDEIDKDLLEHFIDEYECSNCKKFKMNTNTGKCIYYHDIYEDNGNRFMIYRNGNISYKLNEDDE